MIYAIVIGLAVVACFGLLVFATIIKYLLERQDRYVAASLAHSNPVAAAIVNSPDPGVRNARDEQKAAGVNPPVPFMR